MNYFRCLYWLSLPFLAGCGQPNLRVPEYPLLKKYVKRNKVVVKCEGAHWPLVAKNFSEVYGPAFSEEEQREFNDWRVK